MAWPPIPTWEQQLLEQLSQQGSLSGVNPQDLAAIDLAESSGSGGGVNSEGYGGWFGLGYNTTYPGGGSLSEGELTSTTQTAFEKQAEIAAAEFASLLSSHGGDPIAAEQAYQGGGTEGSSIFQQYGLGGGQAFGSPTAPNVTGVGNAVLTSASATNSTSPSDTTSTSTASLGTFGKVLAELDSFLNPAVGGGPLDLLGITGLSTLDSDILRVITRGFMGLVGVGVIFVGFYMIVRQTGAGGIIGIAERQQTEARQRSALDVREYEAETARSREARATVRQFGTGEGATGINVPPVGLRV